MKAAAVQCGIICGSAEPLVFVLNASVFVFVLNIFPFLFRKMPTNLFNELFYRGCISNPKLVS